jgi:hypothetical protein
MRNVECWGRGEEFTTEITEETEEEEENAEWGLGKSGLGMGARARQWADERRAGYAVNI